MLSKLYASFLLISLMRSSLIMLHFTACQFFLSLNHQHWQQWRMNTLSKQQLKTSPQNTVPLTSGRAIHLPYQLGLMQHNPLQQQLREYGYSPLWSTVLVTSNSVLWRTILKHPLCCSTISVNYLTLSGLYVQCHSCVIVKCLFFYAWYMDITRKIGRCCGNYWINC